MFYILLVVIAFLYAAVGHGGASGYLALMAFFSFSPDVMRPTALVLNIFVSIISFLQYYRGGFFRLKLFLPFVVTSIPAAFAGGLVSIDGTLYKLILGILLLFPIVKLIGIIPETEPTKKEIQIPIALFIGAVIGFFSGMIGIGGGIILSPLLLLLHWANMKESAAVSALFIFVNSIAGLLGLLQKGVVFQTEMIWMLVTALFGGFMGAYIGANKWENKLLKRVLAVVLLIAAVKLIASVF